MEKIKNELILGALVVLLTKTLFVQTTFCEMGIILGLMTYSCIQKFFLTKEINEEYKIIVLKQNDVISKMATEIDNLKTAVVGVKMGAGFKNKMGA